jgi:Ras family protein
MLGARNSGKSSVVHRFAERRFGAAYDPTIESTIRAKIVIRGVAFMCDLLDTAGQDEYSSFSRQATVGVHGYCMVFSVTSMQSFQSIQKIHDRITDLVGSYTVSIVLVGTKSDDETRREVPSAAGEALAESWGANYVECSAKSDFGIEDVFVSLLFEIERDSGLLALKDSEDSDEQRKGKSCAIM